MIGSLFRPLWRGLSLMLVCSGCKTGGLVASLLFSVVSRYMPVHIGAYKRCNGQPVTTRLVSLASVSAQCPPL